jgi:hypothetical protein
MLGVCLHRNLYGLPHDAFVLALCGASKQADMQLSSVCAFLCLFAVGTAKCDALCIACGDEMPCRFAVSWPSEGNSSVLVLVVLATQLFGILRNMFNAISIALQQTCVHRSRV